MKTSSHEVLTKTLTTINFDNLYMNFINFNLTNSNLINNAKPPDL